MSPDLAFLAWTSGALVMTMIAMAAIVFVAMMIFLCVGISQVLGLMIEIVRIACAGMRTWR